MIDGSREIAPGAAQHRGEVMEFMAKFNDGSIDILITDPPYEVHINSLIHSKSKKYAQGKATHYDQIQAEGLGTFLQVCFEKMATNSALFLMTNRENRSMLENLITDAGFKIKNELVWVKVLGFDDGLAMGNHYLNAVEYVIYAHKGRLPKVNEKMNAFVKKSPHRGRNSKPEELYAHILEPWLEKMNHPLIVDPFAGSDPLNRAKMRGLIHSCSTVSNIYPTGDQSDPAHHGELLTFQNLNKWMV